MTTDPDAAGWPERLAARIGARVKALRERPGVKLSAQGLADRTRMLGHEIGRSVIANMESGRRGTVTLADVLVLARALGVPPLALIAPLEGDEVEVLPGTFLMPWNTLSWLEGTAQGVPPEKWEESTASWDDASETYYLRHLHEVLVAKLIEAKRDANEMRAALPAEQNKILIQAQLAIWREIRDVREKLLELGVKVPEIDFVDPAHEW